MGGAGGLTGAPARVSALVVLVGGVGHALIRGRRMRGSIVGAWQSRRKGVVLLIVMVSYTCTHTHTHIVVVRPWESGMRCMVNATFPRSDN